MERTSIGMVEADKKLSVESLAIGLSHAIYRNTDFIENSHANNALMDKCFYDNAYKVLANGIADMKKYWTGIKILCKFSENEIAKIMFEIPIRMNKMADYIGNVAFGIVCGSKWDKPVELKEKVTKNWAEYVLAGEFKKNCDGKNHFGNDALMAEINKDICNRIYTILRSAEID